MPRLAWPEYFMNIAHLVAERSTCLRRRVGAVAVKDKRILATGYNGAPSHTPHCLDVGCLRDELKIPSGERHELCRGLHAEQNVIIQCAVHGISMAGSTIYCTHQPCLICSKMLINCEVRAIWFATGYPDPMALSLLKNAGVDVGVLTLSQDAAPFPAPAAPAACACAARSGGEA